MEVVLLWECLVQGGLMRWARGYLIEAGGRFWEAMAGCGVVEMVVDATKCYEQVAVGSR